MDTPVGEPSATGCPHFEPLSHAASPSFLRTAHQVSISGKKPSPLESPIYATLQARGDREPVPLPPARNSIASQSHPSRAPVMRRSAG